MLCIPQTTCGEDFHLLCILQLANYDFLWYTDNIMLGVQIGRSEVSILLVPANC